MTTPSSYPAPPPWFEEEALPKRLLESFLRKLEKGQRLSLRISPKTAPELYDFQHEDVKFLWALVKSLDKEYHILTIRLARVEPSQEVYENAQILFAPDKEELVRQWLDRPALDPYALVWQHQLSRMASQFEDGGQALFDTLVRLPEQGAEQTLRAFARIGAELQSPTTLRALSARCFWGDSKCLDRYEYLVTALFPSLAHNLVPRPILMAVHLPEHLERLLFVENQDTFISLAREQPPGAALVYSAGFRGSALRIREHGNVVFSYLNLQHHQLVRDDFEAFWFGGGESLPTAFWGDLDFAGMAILKALRYTFTHTRAWRPGYALLLERLHSGWGHTHHSSGKSQQRDPDTTGCPYADAQLLPAMRETGSFIDQEAVNPKEIESASR